MTHQSGITALGTTDHVYLELDLIEGKDPKEAIGRLAAAINLPTTVGANAVVGVRPELWAKVSDAQHVPNDVHGVQRTTQRHRWVRNARHPTRRLGVGSIVFSLTIV